MNEKLIAILAELRHYLEVLHGEQLVQVVLYGSQARGDAKPDSDIDILIVLQPPVDATAQINRTGDFVAALSLQHNTVVSRAFVSDEQFHNQNGPFFRNVRREGITV
ncbi:MAG: nucleotidyltransferase domain-containing protein [Chroococcidiopsidaceae cyanobacterium CP_BM_RX_35]|nr:nucleotidyltransferase domain-containing protein [Chroococcidiopsidaceae cyanobacterium CP_BM_RX_35]